MVSVWFFVLWTFVAMVLGMIIMAGLLFILSYVSGIIRKKSRPRDKESLKDAGPITMDIKEVKENERKRVKEFREFEKLRRKYIKLKSTGNDKRREERIRELQGGQNFTRQTPGIENTDQPGKREDKSTTGNSKVVKIIRPTDWSDE